MRNGLFYVERLDELDIVKISYATRLPLRIRVRIGPPNPPLCHKRQVNDTGKPRPRITAGVAR
jgi:hypothetical protein